MPYNHVYNPNEWSLERLHANVQCVSLNVNPVVEMHGQPGRTAKVLSPEMHNYFHTFTVFIASLILVMSVRVDCVITVSCWRVLHATVFLACHWCASLIFY